MNGEPLPAEHGFPARLIVPGLYGYVSATKWLGEIELSTLDSFDSYWVRRGWAASRALRTGEGGVGARSGPAPRIPVLPENVILALS